MSSHKEFDLGFRVIVSRFVRYSYTKSKNTKIRLITGLLRFTVGLLTRYERFSSRTQTEKKKEVVETRQES